MRIHFLQHVEFEGAGSIGPWMTSRGHEVSFTRLFAGQSLPDPAGVEWLIALGGPMSVNDEDSVPWLRTEKRFVERVMAGDRPVLGICLGAQLIAAVAGARIFANSHREIGWWDCARVPGVSGTPWAAVFPPVFPAFHWHGETFALPAGARHLARTDGCALQAFALGDRILGLQFHLETTPATAAGLCRHARNEIVPGPYVQSQEEILGATRPFAAVNAHMATVLAHLEQAAGVAPAVRP